MTDSEAKLIESMADDYSNVLKEAKSMGCNEIKALYNIPLKNMEMIVQALGKQIPKKPTYEGDGYAPDGSFVLDVWICPCCENKYEVYYEEYDYCPNCGQKIDWGK